MLTKSADCLNCPLTRYLKATSAAETADGSDHLAATLLSFLGIHPVNDNIPDSRNLQYFMEMLVAQSYNNFYTELKQHCIQCPLKTDCPVGKIVLKEIN